MSDLFRTPWNRVIPTALTVFIVGWFIGSATTGWVPIAAWVLAVVASTIVVAATIDSAYNEERMQHRDETAAAQSRIECEIRRRQIAEAGRVDAVKALDVSNRLAQGRRRLSDRRR